MQNWKLAPNKKKLRKVFILKDFLDAMRFVKKIAIIAEKEGHHPDIHIFYNKVVIELWTHTVEKVTKKDVMLSKLIDDEVKK